MGDREVIGRDRRAEIPLPPPVAQQIFGDRLGLAEHYAALLATTGVDHGLLGPREAPRLWDRHLLNCAVVERLLPPDTGLVDVGSGAGLPGLVIAVARPDVRVHLVEPLLRRTTWLTAAVEDLGLGNVTVHRSRAEALWDELSAPYVTARAVARLGELARWCLPLCAPGGALLALKGRRARQEVDEDAVLLRALGAAEVSVTTLEVSGLPDPTTVVRIDVDEKGVRPSTTRTDSLRSAARVGAQGAARRPRRGRRDGRRGG